MIELVEYVKETKGNKVKYQKELNKQKEENEMLKEKKDPIQNSMMSMKIINNESAGKEDQKKEYQNNKNKHKIKYI